MKIEQFFSFPIFLFLLSALLSVASLRSESRWAHFFSRVSYRGATLVSALLLILRLAQKRSLVISDFFEGILLSIVILGALSLVFERRFRANIDPAFFSTLCLLWVLISLMKLPFGIPVLEPKPLGLGSHTFFMFLALAAFSLSFLFAALFLVQDFFLKEKIIGAFISRLPPLELAARLNFSFLTVGTASLFAGVLAGVFYFERNDANWSASSGPTIFLSFFTLAVYALIMTVRIGPLERGRGTAFVAIVSFSLLLLTFFAAHNPGGVGGV